MIYLIDYFLFGFPILVWEIFAFIFGKRYVKHNPNDRPVRFFVGYLTFVVILEILALYAIIAYFSEYRFFGFIEETKFRKSSWLYNIYDVISPIAIIYYFLFYIKSNAFSKWIRRFLLVFTIVALYIFLIKESVFRNSPTVVISGFFLVLITLFRFFYELLKSNIILSLKHYLPMYIAVGVFVFQLVNTPLVIFTDYFNISSNRLFVELQVYIVLISNLFMYSCFIAGFLICSKKKKYS